MRRAMISTVESIEHGPLVYRIPRKLQNPPSKGILGIRPGFFKVLKLKLPNSLVLVGLATESRYVSILCYHVLLVSDLHESD